MGLAVVILQLLQQKPFWHLARREGKLSMGRVVTQVPLLRRDLQRQPLRRRGHLPFIREAEQQQLLRQQHSMRGPPRREGNLSMLVTIVCETRLFRSFNARSNA